MSGSVPIGIATSNVRPTSAPKNPAAATPTIVNGTRSTVSERPIDVGGAAEPALPEAVADDGDRPVRPAAAPIVRLGERAAEQRRHAEHVEDSRRSPTAPSTNSVCPPSARLKRVLDHAKAPSNSAWRSRTCSQIGLVQELWRPSLPVTSRTSRCGSPTGSDRSSRLSTIEKMAVLAPMPSASDSTATAVTIGVALRAR